MYNNHLKQVTTYAFPKKENNDQIDLSLNEFNCEHSDLVKNVMQKCNTKDLSTYYKFDNNHEKFIQLICEYLGGNLSYKNILVSSGSDMVIEHIFKTFLNNDDYVQIFKPTYPLTELKIELTCNKICTELKDSDNEIAIDEHCKLIYFINPNNPLGYDFNDKLLELIIKNPNKIFIIDEAYIELSTNKSFISLIEKYPNIIVTRTFSKGFGLPGIRIGYCVFNEIHSDNMNKTYSIRNLNPFSVRIAMAALLSADYYRKIWNSAQDEYKKIKSRLDNLNKTSMVYGYQMGNAPFYLIYTKNISYTYEYFKAHNIIVRNKSSEIPNSLRISVSKPEINEIVLQLIENHE